LMLNHVPEGAFVFAVVVDADHPLVKFIHWFPL
jgi:hypothetical protein